MERPAQDPHNVKDLACISRESFTYKVLNSRYRRNFSGFLFTMFIFCRKQENVVLKTLRLPNIPGEQLKYLHFFPVW